MREATSQAESWPKVVLTGAQMLFVAFGALVLVRVKLKSGVWEEVGRVAYPVD
ncbi:hypothetical protein [Vreelandella arctica]|uniref:hypothetical protein n=1 Tax=Vreelandella arctica TaxID=3126499 RepID=UPI00300DEDED